VKANLTQKHRRSARISIQIPVQVFGVESSGTTFCDLARTESVSEHGGCLVMKRVLVPQQELRLRRLLGEEITVRVIGEVRRTAEGILYGVSFLEGSFDYWGIHFPASALKLALYRVLLECSRCTTREVVPLNDRQLAALDDEERLQRTCEKCDQQTDWVRTELAIGLNPAKKGQVARAVAKTDENRRKSLRARLKLTACIRKPGSEEIVPIVDVSRGGLRFRSERIYGSGNWVQVAVPFTMNTANIFVPAQVIWHDDDAGPDHEYGLKYIK
jgi:PilZ domain-containing protein